MTFTLSDIERDAFTELVNIGLSRAAGVLRELVHEQVHLSVPSVVLAPRGEAIMALAQVDAVALVAVQMVFTGDLSGHALLIFSEDKALDITRAVVGEHVADGEMRQLEKEALAETGNIILNGYLSTIANMLQRSLDVGLPEILRGDPQVLFAPVATGLGEYVISQNMKFTLRSRDIEGRIAMIMDVPSLQKLQGLISEFISHASGAGAHIARA